MERNQIWSEIHKNSMISSEDSTSFIKSSNFIPSEESGQSLKQSRTIGDFQNFGSQINEKVSGKSPIKENALGYIFFFFYWYIL